MIILRQREFAGQDLAGATTANEIKSVKKNRGILAGLKTTGRRRNQRWLNKQNAQIDKMGLNEKELAVAKQNVLETYNQKNQQMQGRSEKGLNIFHRLFAPPHPAGDASTKTTTKNNPTQVYQQQQRSTPKTTALTTTNTQPIVPATTNTGSKFGQFMKNNGTKIAIGTGIAAAGYGAYKLYQANKKKQQEEEERRQATLSRQNKNKQRL